MRDLCRIWQPAQSGHGTDADADITITATGFTISMTGDIAFSRDGRALDLSQPVAYCGAMFTGVPNLAAGV